MTIKKGKLVVGEDNKKRIQFDKGEEATENLFKDSIYKIVSMTGKYDLGLCSKIGDDEVFYIYDKSNNKALEDVTNIMKNDVSLNENFSDTIFWNMENETIVIIGREPLYYLVNAFERQKWMVWLKLFDQDYSFKSSIPEESLSQLYKKTIKILEKTP